MVSDPFKYYTRSHGTRPGETRHQNQEFLQSFHEAVDAIKAGKKIDESHFGRTQTQEDLL